jgi:hypothetical protein
MAGTALSAIVLTNGRAVSPDNTQTAGVGVYSLSPSSSSFFIFFFFFHGLG